VNPPGEPRKTYGLWIIIGIALIALMVAGGVGILYFGGKFLSKSVASRNERRARIADLETQRRELTEAAKASVEEGSSEGMAERLAKFGETVGNAAESTSGTERQSLRVAQRMVQSMAPALSSYESAFKELQAVGFVQPETIKSREAIASRVAVVKKFGEANASLSRTLDGMEKRVRVELEQEGVPVRQREQFVTGFLKSANLDLNRTIRKCDAELVTTLLNMLAVLDREWGAWKAENGSVIFNRDPVIEEYNKLVEALDDIAERQTTAQQELLKRASKPSPLR
jgi:hypothetical protein